jgi:DNA-directed RNA polymerase alpha subunit
MKIHTEFTSLAEMASFARYLNQFKPDDPKPKQTEQEKEDSWRWKFEKTQANLERALHRIRILDPEGKTANYDANAVSDSVDTLGFTVRTSNCLKAANILTIDQLCSQTSNQLFKIDNLGRKSLKEIIETLAAHNLKIKDDQ